MCTKLAPMNPAPPVTSNRMVITLAGASVSPSPPAVRPVRSVSASVCPSRPVPGSPRGRPRPPVLVEASGDRVRATVGDHRVDQLVAARLGDVLLGEPEPFPVVQVVAQIEVEVRPSDARSPGRRPIGASAPPCVRAPRRRCCRSFSGLPGVFWGGQVRMRAGAARAASFSTLGPSAAITRRLVGTFCASSASRYSTNTS